MAPSRAGDSSNETSSGGDEQFIKDLSWKDRKDVLDKQTQFYTEGFDVSFWYTCGMVFVTLILVAAFFVCLATAIYMVYATAIEFDANKQFWAEKDFADLKKQKRQEELQQQSEKSKVGVQGDQGGDFMEPLSVNDKRDFTDIKINWSSQMRINEQAKQKDYEAPMKRPYVREVASPPTPGGSQMTDPYRSVITAQRRGPADPANLERDPATGHSYVPFPTGEDVIIPKNNAPYTRDPHFVQEFKPAEKFKPGQRAFDGGMYRPPGDNRQHTRMVTVDVPRPASPGHVDRRLWPVGMQPPPDQRSYGRTALKSPDQLKSSLKKSPSGRRRSVSVNTPPRSPGRSGVGVSTEKRRHKNSKARSSVSVDGRAARSTDRKSGISVTTASSSNTASSNKKSSGEKSSKASEGTSQSHTTRVSSDQYSSSKEELNSEEAEQSSAHNESDETEESHKSDSSKESTEEKESEKESEEEDEQEESEEESEEDKEESEEDKEESEEGEDKEESEEEDEDEESEEEEEKEDSEKEESEEENDDDAEESSKSSNTYQPATETDESQ